MRRADTGGKACALVERRLDPYHSNKVFERAMAFVR